MDQSIDTKPVSQKRPGTSKTLPVAVNKVKSVVRFANSG